jgi:ABC-2 type transport system permease protein
MWLKKYLQILITSWQNTFVYRLSLIMWQLESVILFLGSYLFWLAAFEQSQLIQAYDKTTMLTYIIGILVLRNIIFTSRTSQVAAEISTGELSKYLIRPLSYLKWMFTLEWADKISNLFFMAVELIVIFLLFRPPFFFQTNWLYLGLFGLSIIISIFLYFYLSLAISLTTFWYVEHNGWPQRFLFETTMIFLTGGWFPLDLLPKPVFNLLNWLPSTYIRYFPLQIYLGRLDNLSIYKGLFVTLIWTWVLSMLTKKLWQKGLKSYTASGI